MAASLSRGHLACLLTGPCLVGLLGAQSGEPQRATVRGRSKSQPPSPLLAHPLPQARAHARLLQTRATRLW